MKVAIMLADGFEEIEAFTPKDVLNRAGIECELISTKIDREVTGAHGITVKADRIFDNNLEEYDMIVLPGGLPGAKYLAENTHLINVIREFDMKKKYIGAICAAPALVLSKAGIVQGKKVTSYPGMEKELKDAIYEEKIVVQDENIITSRGPATALAFSYKLVEVLGKNVNNLKSGMLYNSIER